MPGGLVQLLAWGSQNIKLNGNPSITFFKTVWKAHTNFSMESIRVNMSRTTVNVYENTILKAKLGRHGDLVQQVYLVLELPDIAANAVEFQWIEHLGEVILNNAYVTIGGTIVDRQYGEQLHVQRQLSLTGDKRTIYNRMIGNVSVLTAPKEANGGSYPSATPAVPRRKIYVPLDFWFNRGSGSALPLVCLQYNETEITLELRPIRELYTVLVGGQRMAPNPNVAQHQLAALVSNARATYMTPGSNTVLDMRAYLEVNYVFLDRPEREMVTYKTHEYLVEQTTRLQRFAMTNAANVFELVLQNPVKEFIWVFRRNDADVRNSWVDFLDGGVPILQSAKWVFNGMDRVDDKDQAYYGDLQPWQHHRACPKEGIYVYSFALNPDEGLEQPSGACNMSRVQKVQMMLSVMTPLANTYAYDLTVYAIGYNFLKISSGLAGLVFSA